MIRPIRTEKDYQEALARIETLMSAEPGTDDFDTLEVLSSLVEIYEGDHFPMDLPSPVAAIKFRMEQQDLSPRDLVPYIGSRAKVSAVLAGKLPLTLSMIRALHEHLGIPAEVLLGQTGGALPDQPPEMTWSRFPLKAMAKVGWFSATVRSATDRAEEVMRGMISAAGGQRWETMGALYRKNEQSYRNSKSDPYALQAWCLEVLGRARKQAASFESPGRPETVTLALMQDIARLSWSQEGPRLAREYLARHGIPLIVLAHLPRTYLDGAALMLNDGTPVVGLTLRYDRIDAFWFNLLHELAHIACHLRSDHQQSFLDDFDLRDGDTVEREADQMAQAALIPESAWIQSGIAHAPTPMAAMALAQQLGIHPAIIAGRVRHDTGNYRLLSQFVGSGEVRPLFREDNPLAWKQ